MSAMTSQITGVLIVHSTIFSGADEGIKAPRHWPLWGAFTDHRWIPRKKRHNNAENVSIWWHHHAPETHLELKSCEISLPITYFPSTQSVWKFAQSDIRIPLLNILSYNKHNSCLYNISKYQSLSQEFRLFVSQHDLCSFAILVSKGRITPFASILPWRSANYSPRPRPRPRETRLWSSTGYSRLFHSPLAQPNSKPIACRWVLQWTVSGCLENCDNSNCQAA